MNKASVGSLLAYYDQYLYEYYNCNATLDRGIMKCSNYEIALMQWSTCQITLNSPPQIADFLPIAGSVVDWNNKIGNGHPWEYYNVTHTLYNLNVFQSPPQILTIIESLELMSYQTLFAETVVYSILLDYQNGLSSNITNSFFITDPFQLTSYFR